MTGRQGQQLLPFLLGHKTHRDTNENEREREREKEREKEKEKERGKEVFDNDYASSGSVSILIIV